MEKEVERILGKLAETTGLTFRATWSDYFKGHLIWSDDVRERYEITGVGEMGEVLRLYFRNDQPILELWIVVGRGLTIPTFRITKTGDFNWKLIGKRFNEQFVSYKRNVAAKYGWA